MTLSMTYNDHKIENLNLNLCKSILVMGSKASNLAVVGELGRYPLYIDIVISMIKYWIRLHEDKTNCILKLALDENNKMPSSTASQLHCLHILFSTAVIGIVYLPLSISSLCALIRKRARVDRFDNSFILSKYFSCWNIKF
jgi:hypothetical protein